MEPRIDQNDVFKAGMDGVHTYRIPSLLVTANGTLLAFAEARKISNRDASPTDMVLKRSFDKGETWEPMQRILPGIGEEAIMNPCALNDGDDVLLFCINAHKTGEFRHRHLLMRSRDDGATWSEPEDLTDSIENGDEKFISGPGVGIRMRSGRLVIPGYSVVCDAAGKRQDTRGRVLYSDDHGQSWHMGGMVSGDNTNESQVVELGDGSLLLNSRIQKSHPHHPGCRGLAVSRDGGVTWEESFLKPELNEMPCQGGFIRFETPNDSGRAFLLFSNPDARLDLEGSSRTRMTVKISEDEGNTWRRKLLLHKAFSIYSSPALLPDGRIGLLYEWGSYQWGDDLSTRKIDGLRFARFRISDVKSDG